MVDKITQNYVTGGQVLPADMNRFKDTLNAVIDLVDRNQYIRVTRQAASRDHGTATRNIDFSITIPNAWGSYDVWLVGTCHCNNSNNANSRRITATAFFDGSQSNGVTVAKMAAQSESSAYEMPMAQQGFWGPKTNKGNLSGRWQLQCDQATTTVTTSDVEVTVIAFRLT